MISRHNTDLGGRQSGAVLLLVAFVMLFIGVMATFQLGLFSTKQTFDEERITQQREEQLVAFLASFAQQYGRLPCAANPAVNATSALFGRENRASPAALCGTTQGIVPFHALGLDARDAQDGWGRYFSYAVSPVFTNLNIIADTGINIHNVCRYSMGPVLWVDDANRMPHNGGGVVSALANLNRRKAKFCCPGPVASGFFNTNTDLRMYRTAGGAFAADYPGPRTVNAGSYGNIDTPFNVYVDPLNVSAIAFVIVSHGRDGAGAFVADGTAARLPGAAGDELANADGDRDFVDRPATLAATANYYDDIVIYRTQTALYNELSSGSCIRPF